MQKFRKMVKVIAVIGLCVFTISLIASCVTFDQPTTQHYGTATWLGAVGAGVGALVDKDNRWRGAVIGGALGAITGYGLAEISRNAAIEASRRGSTVTYYNQSTGEWVQADPMGEGNVRIRTGRGSTMYEERYEYIR